jgi:hypothetical protein
MRKIFNTWLYALVVLTVTGTLLCTACSTTGNKAPHISGLEASTLYVYPTGKSTIDCIVSDPEGDDITFKWACSDGEFIGSGPVVTWKAPNKYGDCHIMVIAQDTNGNSDQATLTIGVLVNENENQSCCGR